MARRSGWLLAAVVVIACTRIPAVPTVPIAGQTRQQVARDERECAEGKSTWVDGQWEACMISRGYRLVYPRYGGTLLLMWTASTQPRSPEQVEADIKQCVAHAKEVQEREAWSFGIWRPPGARERVSQAYTDCMQPRGYRTEIYEPERR